MTKNKFNNIKLVNNWIIYKLDPVLENPLVTNSDWNASMVGDVTSPNIFSSVLDDLQKRPLWGVGGLFPSPSLPVAPPLQ